MNQAEILEKRFYILLKSTPLMILEECLKHSQGGEMPDICRYIQLKLLKIRSEKITPEEVILLNKLSKKYSDFNVEYLNDFYNKFQKIPSLDEVNQELKEISFEMKEIVKKAHEKNPQKGYAGFLEYIKALNLNITDFREYKYNQTNHKELAECYHTFRAKEFILNDSIKIKLQPGALVHILVGHIEKYSIPRKGKMIWFSKANNWRELLELLGNVILFLSDDLILHYTEYNHGYDNKKILFDGCFYGIHLNKRKEIKTFYELKSEC